jgi:hypothetical protein
MSSDALTLRNITAVKLGKKTGSSRISGKALAMGRLSLTKCRTSFVSDTASDSDYEEKT